MITVDVEAQPARAEADHVDRLIWGRFEQGQAGIGEMMDIAEKHGVRLTMFLDWAETDLYGDAIFNVGREIHVRGHDLQLHLHADFFAESLWAGHGITSQSNLNLLSPEQAEAVASEIVSRQVSATGTAPLAFRGGGYRFNEALLDALRAKGVRLDSSVNVSRETQPFKLPLSGQFLWPNGMIEVPVSSISRFRNLQQPLDLNFNSAVFADIGRIGDYLDRFWDECGEDAVAVMVLHSWSFLRLVDRRCFHYDGAAQAERFDALLTELGRRVETVTAADLITLQASGGLALSSAVKGEHEWALQPLGGSRPAAPEAGTPVAAVAGIGREIGMDGSMEQIDELCGEAERLWSEASDPANAPAAVALFKRAYALGDVQRAGYRLGNAYYFGKGAEKDLDAAYDFFAQPGLDGIRFARYYRGVILGDPRFKGFDELAALRQLKRAQEMGVAQADALVEKLLVKRACPICGTKPEIGDGPPDRTCRTCRSLERQRVFAEVYRRNLAHSYDLEGKKGLLVSPSAVERRIFKDIVAAEVTTLDIRPEVGADVVADICGRTPFPDDAFDLVFASYVLSCVHDLGLALAEIYRILRPGGTLVTIDPLAHDGDTLEIADPAVITRHYGQEAFDKYKVGSFRRLGKTGLAEALSQKFWTQIFSATDPLADLEMSVFAATKRPEDYRSESEARRRAEVGEIVNQNKLNEIAANCEFSDAYREYRRTNPSTSYAAYAVAIEAQSVADNSAHATLGLNVTDRSLRQGSDTFEFFRGILAVRPEHRVVDYGCGSLRVGVGFIDMLGPGQYFGLDVVPTFYDLGCQRIGMDKIRSKQVGFHVIDEEGIREGEAFGADRVYSTAVLFHIHPDDIEDAASNIARLAAKPHARVLFDAKVTRSQEPQRYAQKDGKGGWAWPLRFYRQAFAPLELVGVHGRVPYSWEPSVDFAYLEYRMPLPAKTASDA